MFDPRVRSAVPYVLAAVSVASVAAVYSALVGTYFVADDFSNMLTLVDRGPVFFILQPFGGHMLLFRNTVFWLNRLWFGMHAEGYGWVILLTHLLNTLLFFRAARGFTGSAVLGALGAVFWGTSPLLSGALEWYSVYGQVLSGTCLLFVLDRVAAHDDERGPVALRDALIWSLVLLVGSTCFGVGIALAVAFPVAMALFSPRTVRAAAPCDVFLTLPGAVVLLYFGSRALFEHFYPMPFAETMMKGLVLSAFTPILVLFGRLAAVGAIGLVESFAFVPSTYPASGAWAAALFAALFFAGLALGDARARRRLLACAVLGAAVYGFIAVGRANVYAFFKVPLADAALTPRYHYVATIPLALSVPLSIAQIARRLAAEALVPVVSLAGWSLFALVAFQFTTWKVDVHQPVRAYVSAVMRSIDAAVDAAPQGTDVYLSNPAVPYVVSGPSLGYPDIPGPAALFALTYDEDRLRGRRVHFVEASNYKGLFARPENHRLSTLFARLR